MSNLNRDSQMSSDRMTTKLDDLIQRVHDMSKLDPEEALINRIFYSGLENRKESLCGPSLKTFQWIFDPNGGAEVLKDGTLGPPRWDSFSEWLQSTDSSKQYWLSGKAGCGKSTLMVYLVREGLGLRQTQSHLSRWSGSKPQFILSFFLFRATHNQASVEYLLRSLIYQLLLCLPIMGKLLMAEFLPSVHGGRIPTWPLSKLKRMLQIAVQTAEDCNFLLVIDGVDELQDNEQTCSDLVTFLCDVQKPDHVKLCLSSRPETDITRQWSSILRAQLADLNLEDIRTFANTKLEALPELECRDAIVNKVCHRSNGIFLWATFAVQEIIRGYEHVPRYTISELFQRLNEMGDSLRDAISFMLKRIKSTQKRSLYFYLHALQIWSRASMGFPITVALIAAMRSEGPLRDFAASCQREARDLRDFSRGLIEVADPVPSGRPRRRKRKTEARKYLIDTRHKLYGQNDEPHTFLKFWPEAGPWAVVPEDKHIRRVIQHCSMSVALIHHSVYDFMLHLPEEAPGADNAEALMEHEPYASVRGKMELGFQKHFWAVPIQMESTMEQFEMAKGLAYRACSLVDFMMCTRL